MKPEPLFLPKFPNAIFLGNFAGQSWYFDRYNEPTIHRYGEGREHGFIYVSEFARGNIEFRNPALTEPYALAYQEAKKWLSLL
jgi:hypothetical protein